MFWAVDLDSISENCVQSLRKQYPAESAMRFPSIKPNTELREKDGSSPKRISCFGHGGFGTYGGYDAEFFANEVVEKLVASAKINPKIKETLTDFDLFGCMTGCNNGKDKVFAAQVQEIVNQKLAKEGFKSINFKAVTNNALGPDKPFHTVYLRPEYDGTFTVHGNRTEKDFKRFMDINKEYKSIIDERNRILKNPDSKEAIQKEMASLFKIYKTPKSKSAQDPYLSGAVKFIAEYGEFSHMEQIAKDVEQMKSLQDRYVKAQKIEDRIEKIDEKISQFDEELSRVSTVIEKGFVDPRVVVDKTPACNFTKSAPAKSSAQKFSDIKSAFEQITKKEETPSTPTSRRNP